MDKIKDYLYIIIPMTLTFLLLIVIAFMIHSNNNTTLAMANLGYHEEVHVTKTGDYTIWVK